MSQNTEELMSKLRFAEEQLQNERRSRGWLEAELQAGKTLLATLSAKVEKLQESVQNDALIIRDLTRHNESSERKMSQVTQDLGVKLEKAQLKMQTLVADLQARQRASEQFKEDETERQRMVAEELNVLRYKVESFSLQSAEVGNEFRAKARDWEMEVYKGTEALRAVRDHDHALENLHQSIDTSSTAISKKVEMALIDMRTRIDQEARGRFQFENNMKDLYAEVRKILSNQDRDLNDRVEVSRQQTAMALDRERGERDKALASVMEAMRGLERNVRESVQGAMDKVGSQIMGIEDVVNQERIARAKFENQIRSEVEEGFKMIQLAAAKKIDEIQTSQMEARQAVGAAIKTLKEAVVLVEKTGEQKIESIEEVLRAEIRSRMENERTVADLRTDIDSRFENFEKKAMDAIAEVTEQTITTSSKIEQDIRTTAEQLILAKTRTIEDIETQVSQIRKRMKDDEAETITKFRQVQLAAEQIGRDAQTNLENTESRFEVRFQLASTKIDESNSRIRDAETKIEQAKAELEDKLNFRVVQIDSTMNAFKEELDQRVTKKEAANTETRFEASIAGVQSSAGHLLLSIQSVKDDIDKLVTKKEMEEIDGLLKSQIASLGTRISEADGAIITAKEDIATKTSKKDLEKVESDLKSIILGLQLKDVSLDEALQKLQDDVGERTTRKLVSELEERLRTSILDLENRDIDFDLTIKNLKDSLSIRATTTEVSEAEKRMTQTISNVQSRINEVSESITSAKAEISHTVREDVEEMVARINGALDAVQTRTDTLDSSIEGIKIRMSDSEATARTRLQQVSSSLESMIADNVVAIGNLKDVTQQKIDDLAEKIADVPKQLKHSEIANDEFRKKMAESAKMESERMVHWVSELRDGLSSKVSEQEFDRLQTDIHSSIQKLTSQMDIQNMSLEQARHRATETESAARERHRELQATQERAIEEQTGMIRNWRDSTSKRFDDLESRVASVPKVVEQAWTEIRKLRFDVDDKLRSELVKVEKDLGILKGEVVSKVSIRALDASIASAIGPLNSRLDRVSTDIEDIRSTTLKLQQQAAVSTNNEFANITRRQNLANADPSYAVNANIYKPQKIEITRTEGYGEQPDQLPPIPTTNQQRNYTMASNPERRGSLTNLVPRGALSSGSRSNSQTGLLVDNEGRLVSQRSDPALEKLADLASGTTVTSRNASRGVPKKETVQEF
jgi:chromosome segregation ATPase